MANRNTVWATVFVEELARSGLKAVCAAPGSRHTPLMLAFANHDDINVYSYLDERSASFFALGMALATDEPVALVCTSGTAGANMYPAIIEAHQSRVPLIVITADRPHELRHSGANQTIDQIKMFGEFVLWFVDMQLPEANPPAIAFRNLRTTANRAFATANGLRKGVVHLNFPFRKPLEPTEVEGDMVELPEELTKQENHFVNIVQTQAHIGVNSMIALGHIINENRKGLFICCGNGPQPEGTTLYAIAETVNYPVIAEANSLMRHNEYRIGTLGAYDAYLKYAPKPDVIFRLGNVPVSKELNNFIANSGAQHVFYVTEDGVWSDDMHQNGTHIQTNFETLFQLWQEYLPLAEELPKSEFNQQYTVLEKTTWNTIDQEIETGAYFDGAVVYDIVDLIPDESTLFAGNSLPIRHLDQFGKPQNKRIYTYANRGASGIDGNISTALGAGAARPDKPLVAVMGDVTFYHDMNGLLAVHRCGVPVTIVLLNNDGGGIFNRLPIRDYDPHFTDYFVTPHGLDFSHTANLYGLDYVQIDARPESAEQTSARERFRSAFADVVAREKSTLIEVRTDGTFDDQRRKEIVATVGERIKAVGS